MKDEWKAFVDKLKIPAEFLHRDEFLRMLKTHAHNIKEAEFPSIFLRKEEKISLFATQDEINQCKNLEGLMNLITKKLGSA